MHYYALVVIPTPLSRDEAKESIERAMAPHKETWSDKDETHHGFWDWWQLGGRYTGRLDGYKPWDDPQNHEPCDLCGATGVRRDAVGVANKMPERNYCNGCCWFDEATSTFAPQVAGRPGWRVSLAYAPHMNDIGPVRSLEKEQIPFTLITPTAVLHRETWSGETWEETANHEQAVNEVLAPLIGSGAFFAVVDYHF